MKETRLRSFSEDTSGLSNSEKIEAFSGDEKYDKIKIKDVH
jgi:hypothetical protein